MSATDFGANVAGGGIGDKPAEFFAQYLNWFGPNTWGWVIVAIMIVMVILVIAFFFGWIGTATSKKEGEQNAMGSCLEGNSAAMCKQTRETLGNNALAFGYGADPNAFCKNAGQPTNDPWDYMRAEAAKAEALTPYASPIDQFESVAFKAASGY